MSHHSSKTPTPLNIADPCIAAEIDAAPTRRPTVLLVDDDGKLLRGLVRCCGDENFHLLTAVSAAEAMVLLTKQHVDLIVSDNLMSGVLGTDFLADVRKQYPSIKLMVLSGYMPEAVAQRVIDEIGVIQVLNKPCQPREVTAAIQQALRAPADPPTRATAGEM